jgi:hypothetical protein
MVDLKTGMKLKAHFKVEYIPEAVYAGGLYRVPDPQGWMVKEWDKDLTLTNNGGI